MTHKRDKHNFKDQEPKKAKNPKADLTDKELKKVRGSSIGKDAVIVTNLSKKKED